MIRSLRSLRALLGGSRRLVAASVGISIAQSALLVPIAFLVRRLFNVTIPDGDSGSLIWMGVAILVLFLGGSALGLLTRWLSLRATKESIMRLQSRLLEQLFYFPKAYFDRADLGMLHSTIIQDSLRVDAMANALVSILIPTLVVGLALAGTMIVLNPLLGTLLLIAVPIMVVSGRRVNRRVRSRTHAWYQAVDEFSAKTHLALRSMTLTKLHGAERVQLKDRRAELQAVKETGLSMTWWQTLYPQIQMMVSAVIGLVVLVVGGLAVVDDRMSVGDLISFYAVLGLLRTQLSGSLFAVPQIVSGIESLLRLEALAATEAEEPYRGSRKIDFEGAIAIRDVSFEYRPGKAVLNGVSLEMGPGEIVAMAGSNGAGKSTVLSLIAGLYAPTRGVVLADGVPLDELDLPGLRRSIGAIVQDPMIFPTSVRDNIAFGKTDAGREELERAARRAGAHEFVLELPDGYDTLVGDDGVQLSGGQRQKLAIARALLGEPVLLLLDEPTTYLDQEGVEQLIESLVSGMYRPAALIVSHDPVVVAAADRRFHLSDGVLSEGVEAWPSAAVE